MTTDLFGMAKRKKQINYETQTAFLNQEIKKSNTMKNTLLFLLKWTFETTFFNLKLLSPTSQMFLSTLSENSKIQKICCTMIYFKRFIHINDSIPHLPPPTSPQKPLGKIINTSSSWTGRGGAEERYHKTLLSFSQTIHKSVIQNS